MKTNMLALIIAFFLFLGCSPEKENSTLKVDWYSSSPGEIWKKTHVEDFSSETLVDSTTVMIETDQRLQQVDGFGGCFNELGWEALASVSEEEKLNIIKDLFDQIEGCKFNICRMPIGANDYAVDWYSLNETKNDFSMEHFSIERDKKRLIPYIKSALKHMPDLKIWGSPWCPPSWMKHNNHYACKPSENNDLDESGRGAELKTLFKMNSNYLNAYALYFSRFIDSYKREGINISAIHPQNELNSCQDFPSCTWKPSDMATFIGSYLGPKIKQNHPNTDIWLGTVERPHIERIDTILKDDKASKYIKGVGFQWAGQGAIPKVKDKYPELKLMQTETECGDGSNNWASAEHTYGLMKHYFNNGANSYMYWNMVLNETGKSQWGWKQNSMISINTKTKDIRYNPEFYLMKHFSAFVAPGAYRVTTSNEDFLAFINERKLVIICFNTSDQKMQTFSFDGNVFGVQLKKQSINTFEIVLNE